LAILPAGAPGRQRLTRLLSRAERAWFAFSERRKLLFGVAPGDLPTFAAVACLRVLVALAACVIAARRATRVDPIVALRYE